MGRQIVLAAAPGAAAGKPLRVPFAGYRSFTVDLVEAPRAAR